MTEETKRKLAGGKPEEKPPGGVVLRAHEYDGIQEYDQRLPNWWLFTFYIAIAFFVGYWLAFFQFKAIASDADRLEAKLDKIESARSEAMLAMLNDEGLWKMSRDEAVVADGKKIYMTTCMACHGLSLGGRSEGPQYVGEPLNDAAWKYGGNPAQVYEIVHNGSPDLTKGMPPWGPIMGPDGVAEVVAFVMSHHEVSPPGEGPPPTADPNAAPAPVPPASGVDPAESR